MANSSYIFGARFYGSVIGAPVSGTLIPMAFVATDNVAAFVGDVLKMTGESTTINGVSYPVVAQAAAGDTMIGTASSFKEDPTNLTLLYRTASTARVVYVAVDPNYKYSMQMNGTPAASDVGQTYNVTVGSGSTITGISAMQLDRSTVGNDKQFRVIGLYPAEDNEWGAYAKVVCIPNLHQYKVTTAV